MTTKITKEGNKWGWGEGKELYFSAFPKYFTLIPLHFLVVWKLMLYDKRNDGCCYWKVFPIPPVS